MRRLLSKEAWIAVAAVAAGAVFVAMMLVHQGQVERRQVLAAAIAAETYSRQPAPADPLRPEPTAAARAARADLDATLLPYEAARPSLAERQTQALERIAAKP